YIKHENAELKTWTMLKARSYYTVNAAGELVHYIYSNQTGSLQNYTAGKAPAGLKAGEKYTSWDQIHFFDWGGKPAATAYNYYQFLPARTKTVYTAEELDKYIMEELKRREATGAATYKE